MNIKPFWITIARDGDTTDGRHIPAQDLLDIVSNFDPAIYLPKVTAACSGKYEFLTIGVIYAVKATTSEDVTWLRALVQPNDEWFYQDLYDLQAQLVYPSLEYVPDHRPTSERKWTTTFISGLSLTTEPAIRDLEPINKHMVKS
ncbi:GPO family capsid scaffolding protein [Enterobacter ludwigii]|uniref:GPO family capsid scaffolding protein n=1 Tax=Enterobacter ludwigii TaxID=299767 RepID=UPI003F71F2B1